MKHIFILNAYGSYNVVDEYKRIKAICESKSLDYKIEVNDILTTEQILKKYRSAFDIIYAVGGDGMINKVVNGIIGTDNYFSYIPKGTGNDFDRSVKSLLGDDIAYDIDTIRINDRYFINVACFGIDAKIANDDRFIHSTIIPKSMRYNASVLSNFLTYSPRIMEIETVDEKIKRPFTTIAVANGMYYGGGYMISPTSKLNDRHFVLYMVDDTDKLNMAKLVLKMKNGKHLCYPEVHMISTDRLTIKSDEVIDANIDGEKLFSDTFEISVSNHTIKLYNNKTLRKILSE